MIKERTPLNQRYQFDSNYVVLQQAQINDDRLLVPLAGLWAGCSRGHGFQCDHSVAGTGGFDGCGAGGRHRTVKLITNTP
ncbi:hypothetical protein EMIT0215P_10506 [Pseudomonas serboccidentalis]